MEYSCRTATIIKANQDEVSAIFDLLGIAGPPGNSLEDVRNRMGTLLVRFPAEMVVVTRGEKGTLVLNRDGQFHLSEPRPAKGTPHPVGAGDACSAGILFGLTLGWDIPVTMELANRMGADVAAHPSATPTLSRETLDFARVQITCQA